MTRAMTVEELFANSGGGAKIHFNKYSRPGDSVEGTVIHAQVQQARDFDTNELLWWDEDTKLQPRNNLIVTLQTRLRDRAIEDDEGVRRVFIRWQGTSRNNLVTAVQKAGDRHVREGAWMKVTYDGEGEAVGRKNPPKIYSFEYKAPPSDVEKLMSEPEPERAATVTKIPRQAEAQPMLPEPEAEPSAGNAVADASRVQAERREQIAKVKKLNDAGFSKTEIEDMVPGLSRQAITAILEI